MNPLKYAQMMKYLTRAKKANPDLPDVFPASKAPIPPVKQEVKEIEAVNQFMLRNPRVEKAGGGMLVQPSADGSRPGYAREKPLSKSKRNIRAREYYAKNYKSDRVSVAGERTNDANKIINDYKKTVAKFSMKGDLSKAPSLNDYLQTKYGKNYRTQESIIKRYSNFDSRGYLQEQKLNLAEALKNKSNNSLKYEELGNKFILRKVGGEGLREGVNQYSKKLYKIVYDLDSREDKVIKAFKYIIDENLPVKKITKGSSNLQKAGTIKSMIGQLTGINTVAPPFTSGLEKSYKLFAQNFDMTPKEFKESFKYLNQIAKQSNLINVPFDQAFQAATERVKGAAELGGSDMLTFYRDPNSNVVNYIFKHWDRNNFNKTGASRVKLYDRSKLKLVGGELIPKKGYTLNDIEVKWESGKKYNVKDLAFSYDNSKLFDRGVLSTQGKASGLFDEVYQITKDYYSLYSKPIPDPKNPGKNILFGEMMTRDYGKNSLAIGHNNPGGIKVEPISNFELQTQKLNTGIYQATKNFNNPTLKKRIIEELYGELYKFRGGKKYIDQLIKNPPNLSYSEALKNVILRKDFKTLPMSAQREVAISNVVKNMDLPETERAILNKIQSYSKLPKCKVAVADGGRIGFKFSDECIRDGLKEQKIEAQKGNKKAARELVQVGKVATRAGLLKNILGPGAILGELVYEGALIGNKVLGGKPSDIAYAESYLSYLDPRKYRGELDPLKMEREDMLTREVEDADGNIKTINAPGFSALKSGFEAQDQLSAFNKAIEDRDDAKTASRIDLYNPAAADAREQGARADQSANIISSDSFKDASRLAQEYLQGQTGANMAKYRTDDFGAFESGRDKDLRRRRMQEMSDIMPRDFLTATTSDLLNYTQALRELGYDTSTRKLMEQQEAMRAAPLSVDARMYSPEQVYGTQGEFAGGGIAKLAGDSSGRPPASGPNSQGLLSLKNRVRNY